MADLLRWNSLGEAAEWLGHLTGKTWTLRGVLDAALIHTTQRRMRGGPSNLETAIAAALPHGHTLQAYVLNVDDGRERIERMTWLSPEARKASAVPVFTCSPRPVTLLQTDIAQLLQGGWVTLTVARNRHESEECNADGTPRYAVAIEPPATVRLEHLTIRSDHLTALGEALMAAAPRSETPAPATEGSASEPAGPLPLATGDIAFCFAGLRWTEQEWRKPLGDKPKWLEACIAVPGRRGVSETRWYPVCIAAALVLNGHANARSVRAAFQRQPLLMPWLEAWKTYEADYIDSE